jgi:hypothetical protein
VTAVGGIDDAVGGARFGLQQACIVERTDHRLDAMGPNSLGLGTVANQTANAVPAGDQNRGDRAADKAVRAGDEDKHVWPSRCCGC